MIITRKARTWAAVAVSAVLTCLVAGTAAGEPAGLPPLLKIKSGTADLCLDPGAQSGLVAGGIGMTVGAPAQLVTAGPQPCVTTHVTDGAVTLGLTGGNFPFNGTITFTRATDQAAVTFSDLKVTFGVLGNATAVVNGDAAHPITLLTFVVPPTSILTDGRFMFAHDVPFTLTADGAKAFAAAFGASPVTAGKALFDGTGYGELEAGLLPLI